MIFIDRLNSSRKIKIDVKAESETCRSLEHHSSHRTDRLNRSNIIRLMCDRISLLLAGLFFFPILLLLLLSSPVLEPSAPHQFSYILFREKKKNLSQNVLSIQSNCVLILLLWLPARNNEQSIIIIEPFNRFL